MHIQGSRVIAGLAALALLAACQTTTGANPASSPMTTPTRAAQPVIQPAQVFESGDTRTRTSVGSDGTVRSTTTSTNVSVDAGVLLGTLLGGAAAAPVNTPADYEGQWTLRQPDGRTCQVTLRGKAGTRRALSPFGCFHDSVFGTSGWDLRGRDVVLFDTVGTETAVLRATGPNRLEGGGLILYR